MEDSPANPLWRGCFTAMANPCELLVGTADATSARRLTELAVAEALRIERKFSRYRDDSVTSAINKSHGEPVEVDAETARLLDYGRSLWELSDGAFDLTSGVLRRIWKFGEGARPPTAKQVRGLVKHIGWQHLQWHAPFVRMQKGMELDFGGIGKEYAVDRVAEILGQHSQDALLINFGGDLRAIGPPPPAGAWRVGIESLGRRSEALQVLALKHGALATSGDARRFIEHEGKRYGHIFDARTGWPPDQAPRSITAAADTCIQAGTFTTLAMLQGARAEAFLDGEEVRHWCFR